MHGEGEAKRFIRYKYRYNNCPVFDHNHIIARFKGTEESVVKLILPSLEVVDRRDTAAGFKLGSGENKWKLMQGGIPAKEIDGKLYYYRYQFPFRSDVKVLSDEETLRICSAYKARIATIEEKENVARKDCRELQRQLNNTNSPLLHFLTPGEDDYYHICPIDVDQIDRTDEEEQNHSIFVRPELLLDAEKREQINTAKKKHLKTRSRVIPNGSIYFSKDPFAVYCHLRKLLKSDGVGFKFLWMKIRPRNVHPTGLPYHVFQRTPGVAGVFQSAHPAEVISIAHITLGNYGLISPDNSLCRLIRANGDMDVLVDENLKVHLKEHSEQYNNGLLWFKDLNYDSDDEVVLKDLDVFEESTNAEAAREFLERKLSIKDKKLQATNDRIHKACKDFTDTADGDEYELHWVEYGGLRPEVCLDLDELDVETMNMFRTEGGMKMLKKVFRNVEKHWKNIGYGKIKVVHDVSNQDMLDFMTRLRYFTLVTLENERAIFESKEEPLARDDMLEMFVSTHFT